MLQALGEHQNIHVFPYVMKKAVMQYGTRDLHQYVDRAGRQFLQGSIDNPIVGQ